jgi:hypothetical protein
MVDIETNGPIPGDYSMISFGAVLVDKALANTFYGQLRPISDKWLPESLSVSGFSSEETLNFKHLRKTPHTHHPVDDARGKSIWSVPRQALCIPAAPGNARLRTRDGCEEEWVRSPAFPE